MVVMAGSGLFWMENLPRCTLAAALKEGRTHLVRVPPATLVCYSLELFTKLDTFIMTGKRHV